MKPHKHAELIKAWADGAEIEFFEKVCHAWLDCHNNAPAWEEPTSYRIKPPEPKPDHISLDYVAWEGGGAWFTKGLRANLKLTFDGETGKLKLAEVL
jgi:hypothetical protein